VELFKDFQFQEHLNAPPKDLLMAQTENYVEYNRKGRLIKGTERAAVKSRYDEDM
jgi:pre-mRNA-processing factor SLU7